MKVLSLNAKNFWSFEELSLDRSIFDQGLHLIKGWNHDEDSANGAGKTAIPDAICYAFTGKIPRSVKVDELVNKKKKKNLFVSMEVEDHGNIYKIERGRKPTVLNLSINGQPELGKDKDELQKIIESTLGLSYDIFVNSVYFCQNAKSRFVSATDGEKVKILTELINLDDFDKAYKVAHELLGTLSVELEMLNQKVTFVTESKQKLEREYKNFEAAYDGFEADKKRRMNEKEEAIDQQSKVVNKIEVDIANLQDSIEKENIDFDQKIQKYKNKINILAEVHNLNNNYANRKSVLLELEKRKKQEIDQLSSLEGDCPRCKQPINEEHRAKEIKKSNEELDSISQEFEQVLAKIKECEELLTFEPTIKEKIEKVESIKRDVQEKVRLKSAYLSNLGAARDVWQNLVGDLETIGHETNRFWDLLKDCKEGIEKTDGELKQLSKEAEEKAEIQQYYIALKDLYKNIKYYVFDTVVNELNDNVNDYVQTLFNADVRISFETETANSKGEIKQKFSTSIIMDNVQRDFESLSGGEKKRIELAVSFALSNIVANRSHKTFNFMFLDEVFEGLDENGRELIVDLLNRLKQERENIFIIDHFNATKDLVDNTISVEKRDGISKIA